MNTTSTSITLSKAFNGGGYGGNHAQAKAKRAGERHYRNNLSSHSKED